MIALINNLKLTHFIISDKKKSLKRQKIVENVNQSKPKKIKKTSESNANPKESKVSVKEIHSIEEGKQMFQWIMNGVDVDDFMK